VASSSDPRATIDDSVPWTLEVNATLRQHALAGNVLFLIYDEEDQAALSAKQVTALWQAPISAGNLVSARLSLSADDGFHGGHTYLVRVAQIVNGKEIPLASGEVRLL
jgi:hypothetical protein